MIFRTELENQFPEFSGYDKVDKSKISKKQILTR